MANFGALASALARMRQGRMQGEDEAFQRDYAVRREQAANASELFRQAAQMRAERAQEGERAYRRTQDAAEAARLADADKRQKEQDYLNALKGGYSAAPEQDASTLLAGMSMLRGGTGAAGEMVQAPKSAAYRRKVNGVEYAAPDMGGPQYATVGGRVVRMDRQQMANAAIEEEARKAEAENARDDRNFRQQAALLGMRMSGGSGSGSSGVGGLGPVDADGETKLRKEFATYMAPHNEIASGLSKVRSQAALGTGQGDMGIIFGYMKMMDPGSTVREGEYATAQNTGSVPDQVRQLYNRALKGEKLAPDVRSKFVQAAEALGLDQRKIARSIMERYAKLGQQYGMPSERVVFDPYSEVLGNDLGGRAGAGLPWEVKKR